MSNEETHDIAAKDVNWKKLEPGPDSCKGLLTRTCCASVKQKEEEGRNVVQVQVQPIKLQVFVPPPPPVPSMPSDSVPTGARTTKPTSYESTDITGYQDPEASSSSYSSDMTYQKTFPVSQDTNAIYYVQPRQGEWHALQPDMEIALPQAAPEYGQPPQPILPPGSPLPQTHPIQQQQPHQYKMPVDSSDVRLGPNELRRTGRINTTVCVSSNSLALPTLLVFSQTQFMQIGC